MPVAAEMTDQYVVLELPSHLWLNLMEPWSTMNWERWMVPIYNQITRTILHYNCCLNVVQIILFDEIKINVSPSTHTFIDPLLSPNFILWRIDSAQWLVRDMCPLKRNLLCLMTTSFPIAMTVDRVTIAPMLLWVLHLMVHAFTKDEGSTLFSLRMMSQPDLAQPPKVLRHISSLSPWLYFRLHCTLWPL